MTTHREEELLESGEGEEKALCVSCMAPNEPSAHFCVKCGAPMSPYAATAPFESLFAEGHVYRQAAERPHSLIVVSGIWVIFGMMAAASVVMIFFGSRGGIGCLIMGAFVLPVCVLIIGKTTKNYLAYRNGRETHDS